MARRTPPARQGGSPRASRARAPPPLPGELPALVKPIVAGEADHVNGSRMLGDYERGPLIRHIGVHFFSRLVTTLTGQRVTDISSGYRATRADTLRKLLLAP